MWKNFLLLTVGSLIVFNFNLVSAADDVPDDSEETPECIIAE